MGGFERVSRNEPCVICGHADWCARLAKYHLCMRVESSRPSQKGGWLHPKEDGLVAPLPERKPEKKDSEYRRIWEPFAMASASISDAKLRQLSAELGVDMAALRLLGVGYSGQDGAWTMPERNARGWVVGVKRRLATCGRSQLYCTGSKPGLTYCDDWHKRPGTIWIVEGSSDTAAGLTLGLCVVGRPSATGGLGYLTQLLRQHRKRRIVVLGENDRKNRLHVQRKNPKHDPACRCCLQCFPGKASAIQMAKDLAKRLRRAIGWMLPPTGCKDLREYVRAIQANERHRYAKSLQKGRFPASDPQGV